MAYFSDAWGDGAIIVLDMNTRQAKRFTGISTQNDPTYRMVIDNNHYGDKIFTTPIDGIAITEDMNSIFWCQVQGSTLYRISTELLRNATSNEEFDSSVEVLGSKEPSDGMKYLNGTLYWGSLTESSLYSMIVNATSNVDMSLDALKLSPSDPDSIQWVCI